MLWEIIGLNRKVVNLDLGLMEPTLKGFRSKSFTASLAVVPTALTLFQRAKVLQIRLIRYHSFYSFINYGGE